MRRPLAFPVLALLCILKAPAYDWKPIASEDLSLKKGRVDAAADAEALSWEVWVADSGSDTVYTHYLRVKIFTDRGAQKYGAVDLEYGQNEHIGDIAGRTIQPDGSTQELKKDAVFDHVVEKRRRSKVRAVSFAMPGVKAGSIVEYRWRMFTGGLEFYQFLMAQREIPCEHVVFHIKPLQDSAFTMRYLPFNVKLPGFKPEGATGFFMSSLDNVPAYTEEEDTPPYTEIRPWIFIYYTEERKESPEKFWKTEGKNLYNGYKPLLKVNGEVKDIAGKAAEGAISPEDKLRRIYEYCRRNIKNVYGDEASDMERHGFKPNRNTAETLTRGLGTGRDIQLAFVALAIAAGFDARLAYLSDREQMILHKETMIPFLPVVDVAVNINGKWRLYDPATRFLEPGRVRWQEEGVNVLIADNKDPEWIVSSVTGSADSGYRRVGRLRLDERGTLEGDLQEWRTGHPAEEWRAETLKHSPSEREKRLGDEVKGRLPGADLTAIKISDPADLSKPVSFDYHIRIEGFATRTGKRLFFAPAIFDFNTPARYVSSTRRYDILMKYPWSETEDVNIQLPPGYGLDQSDAPSPLSFEPVGSYSVRVLKLPNGLLYHRELTFGRNDRVFFPASGYPILKKVFDFIHEEDLHLLTLKAQAAAPAPGNQ